MSSSVSYTEYLKKHQNSNTQADTPKKLLKIHQKTTQT